MKLVQTLKQSGIYLPLFVPFMGMQQTAVAKSLNKHKPNIIFIYADDMGKGMVSEYGQKEFTTPNIDRLIQNGTQFSRAYGCMLSAPARASLLTGYHDCHGQQKWNISDGGRFMTSLQDTGSIAIKERELNKRDVSLCEEDVYLAQVFQKAGYITAQVGKLEWGFTATREQLKRHGWDYYYGFLDHVRCHGYYPPFLFENGDIVPIAGNTRVNCGKSGEPETLQNCKERWDRNGKAVYAQDLMFEKMLAFIRNHKDQPFFLYHPTQLPHGPVAIPAIHPEVANNPRLTGIEKEYASMVKLLDDQIGILLHEIEDLGIADNTIIIFSSDNGHEIYYSQKGRCEKPYRNNLTGKCFDDFNDKYYSDLGGDVFNGNASMAGLKRGNLEGGVHIPLVFYCPGRIPQHKTCDALVTNYDFIPTMAEFLHIDLSVAKDGTSYLSYLMKGKKQSNGRYIVFGSNYGPAIVTVEGWKLRYYRRTKNYELYYLPNDGQERKNIIAEHPDIASELKGLLLQECGDDLNNGVNYAG